VLLTLSKRQQKGSSPEFLFYLCEPASRGTRCCRSESGSCGRQLLPLCVTHSESGGELRSPFASFVRRLLRLIIGSHALSFARTMRRSLAPERHDRHWGAGCGGSGWSDTRGFPRERDRPARPTGADYRRSERTWRRGDRPSPATVKSDRRSGGRCRACPGGGRDGCCVPASATADAERRQLTIMLCDVGRLDRAVHQARPRGSARDNRHVSSRGRRGSDPV